MQLRSMRIVVGEKVITPGCFVQLVMKVKITPPSSQPLPSVQVNGEAEELTTVEQGEEKEIDELIGRRKAGAMGETPDVMVHAPYYPKVHLQSYASVVRQPAHDFTYHAESQTSLVRFRWRS